VVLKCRGCGKTPDQIDEYVIEAAREGIEPEEFVRREEGTFNPKTGLFWCTSCYIAAGEPLGKA
jgi:hypothetical protein